MHDYDPIILISSAVVTLLVLLVGIIYTFNRYQSRKSLMLQEQLELKLNIQKKEIEKLQALDNERNRIYQDLHDNIGSTLAAAKLQANFLKSVLEKQKDRNELEELEQMIELSYEELKEIVWYANSANDNLGNLSLYIKEYAQTYLEKTPIVFHFNENIQNNDRHVTAGMRRDILYSIKELLHNVIKHSQAKKAWIELDEQKEAIHIAVLDNGQGMIEPQTQANSNGIKSLQKRVEKYNGTLSVKNESGLSVKLIFPLQDQFS